MSQERKNRLIAIALGLLALLAYILYNNWWIDQKIADEQRSQTPSRR